MKYNFVVARFNEDVSWLSKITLPDCEFKIYNKGEDNLSYPSIKRPNLGGDSETLINYIVENYDNLPDYVIFTQGNPFDHDFDIIDTINNHTNELFVPLTDTICEESIFGWYEDCVTRRPNEPEPKVRLVEFARALFGDACPQRVKFAAGQQYIISKMIIRSQTKELYQKKTGRYLSF